MDRSVFAPVLAGLAAGIALVVIFAIFFPQMNRIDISGNGNNEGLLIRTAEESSPIVKAFLAKYPDASIKVEKDYPKTHGTARIGVPAVTFYKTIQWTAYYNNTTGFPINDNNAPMDNKTVVITPENSHKAKISNTMQLSVHLSNISGSDNTVRSSPLTSLFQEEPIRNMKPDNIWLGCLTDVSPGTGMGIELAGPDMLPQTESTIIHYIQEGFCFRSNISQ